MSKPSPYQIMAFAVSARERSFSRAAQSLAVTQSSVTQHVANLERQMGAQLFIRRRDGLELTPAGRELFDIADRWASINTLVEERVANYTALDSGHLRIVATAPRPALPLIARFNAEHPNVLIHFTLMNWTQCREAVRDRAVDIAIYTDPPIDKSVYAQKIEEIRYRIYMPSDHRLANRSSVRLSDLQDETIVITEDGSLTQRYFRQKAAELGLEFRRSVKMTTYAVVKEALLHGLGVGLLLENSINETARLTALPVIEMPQVFENHIIIPRDKERLRSIRRFIELV